MMRMANVLAIPISAPLGKWLGAGVSMVIEGNHQYIVILSYNVQSCIFVVSLKMSCFFTIGNSECVGLCWTFGGERRRGAC